MWEQSTMAVFDDDESLQRRTRSQRPSTPSLGLARREMPAALLRQRSTFQDAATARDPSEEWCCIVSAFHVPLFEKVRCDSHRRVIRHRR